MLQIAICDDERESREEIYDVVMHELFSMDEVEFAFYESGIQIMEDIENEKFCSELLFLDIHMPEKNGLEVAAFIREREIDVDIIFITVSTEHVFDGYTYNAFSYILKPMDMRRMEEELGRYVSQKYACANCLHLTINNRRERILLDKVYYFEGDARKIHIHQKGEEQTFYAKMGDLEQMLSEQQFVRCHQSYLVNMKYVTGMTRNELRLEKESLPISRKYLENVRSYMKGGE